MFLGEMSAVKWSHNRQAAERCTQQPEALGAQSAVLYVAGGNVGHSKITPLPPVHPLKYHPVG